MSLVKLFFVIRANAHADTANGTAADVLVRFHILGAFFCIENFAACIAGHVFLTRDGSRRAGVAANSAGAAF